MKFQNKLSTKQFQSLFLLVFGIYFLLVNPNQTQNILKFIGIVFIALGINNIIEESVRRYKIIKPYKSNDYDSKAEKRIAEYFKRKNIIFCHHHKIKIPKCFWIFNIPFVNLVLEPDFYLPEFKVFVEYWGLIDNKDYKKKSYDFKTKLYKENDIEFISLYPKNLNNLDFDFTSKLLDIIKKREGNLRD